MGGAGSGALIVTTADRLRPPAALRTLADRMRSPDSPKCDPTGVLISDSITSALLVDVPLKLHSSSARWRFFAPRDDGAMASPLPDPIFSSSSSKSPSVDDVVPKLANCVAVKKFNKIQFVFTFIFENYLVFFTQKVTSVAFCDQKVMNFQ